MKTIDLRKARKRQRREDYKECIFHAAESVILRKGYRATTMEDIAKEAQFSKATLYQYVNSKAELIEGILLHYYDDMKQILEEIRDMDVGAAEKLRRAIRSTIEFYDEKENFSRVILMDDSLGGFHKYFVGDELKASSSRMKKFIRSLKEKSKEILDIGAEIFREGVESKEFREMDIQAAAYFVDAVLEGILHIRAWTDQKTQTPKEAEMIFGFLMEGFAGRRPARKGEPS